MLFESRGEAKTAIEMKELIYSGEKDKSSKLNFLEWLCALYGKDYSDVNSFVDDVARAQAAEKARVAVEAAAKLEAEILKAKEAKEAEDKLKADKLEAESKLVKLCF